MNINHKWSLNPLGETFETTSGGTPSRSRKDFYNGKICWLKSGELNDNQSISDSEEYITQEALEDSSAKLFPVDTVLIAMYGATTGKLGILQKQASTNQAVCAILPNKNFMPKIVFYYLLWKRQSLIDQGQGGAQPNINQGIIKQLEFPEIPYKEQERIIAKLETQFTRLDAAVKSLKVIKNKLEIYRQSVLKAAFEGKIVEGSDYEIYRISDFCDKVPKIDPPREKFDDFYYIDIGSIDNTKKTVNPPKIVQSNLSPSRARQETLPGDIVYSTVRVYLKNFAMVPELLDRRIISSTGFTVLRPNEKLHNKYLFYYLLSDSVTRMLSAKQRGTSYPAIRDNDVFESPIPVPPKEAQEMVVDEIESRFSVIDKVEEAVDNALLKADRLRKSILKAAFEGKLVEV